MNAPVLIAGGGPVGTFAALLLAKQGVRSIVLERRATINPHPKSRSVSRRTMEVMRGLGVTDEHMDAISLPASWTHVLVYTTTLTGPEIGRVRCPDFTSVPIADSPSMPHMSSQEKYELVLRDLAEECELIDFRVSTTVEGITQTDQACELLVSNANGGREKLTSEYALFADGASSPARQWLGVRMRGTHDIATVLDVHFDVDGLTEQVQQRIAPLLFVASDAGVGVYQPIDGKSEWRCQIFGAADGFGANEAANWIRGTAGDETLDVRVRSIRPWTMHSIMADNFKVGRAFLLGDAAHVLPPTGGLGLNSGLHAVHNLMWKLAGVIQGWAGNQLLETYDQERRLVTEISAQSSFRNSVNFGAIGDAYRSGGDVVSALHQAESYGRFAGLDLGLRYADGAFCSDGTQPTSLDQTSEVYDHSAAPGVRAPHVWLSLSGRKLSSLDLFDQGFCLLAGKRGGQWISAARVLGEKFDIPLTAFAVNAADSPLVGADWLEIYGIEEDGAVLIRPDGHVGFRSQANVEDHMRTLAVAFSACVCRNELRDEMDN
ncbi:MAG: putative polyketide hydroxylase [Gammaproteobacteria bacterium]|jgi:putative polyketide hydroxylase